MIEDADISKAIAAAAGEIGLADPDLVKLADSSRALFRADGTLANADALARDLRKRFPAAFVYREPLRTPGGRFAPLPPGVHARDLSPEDYQARLAELKRSR